MHKWYKGLASKCACTNAFNAFIVINKLFYAHRACAHVKRTIGSKGKSTKKKPRKTKLYGPTTLLIEEKSITIASMIVSIVGEQL
jgi:hypothetical protein